jgi:hypothetical protein
MLQTLRNPKALVAAGSLGLSAAAQAEAQPFELALDSVPLSGPRSALSLIRSEQARPQDIYIAQNFGPLTVESAPKAPTAPVIAAQVGPTADSATLAAPKKSSLFDVACWFGAGALQVASVLAYNRSINSEIRKSIEETGKAIAPSLNRFAWLSWAATDLVFAASAGILLFAYTTGKDSLPGLAEFAVTLLPVAYLATSAFVFGKSLRHGAGGSLSTTEKCGLGLVAAGFASCLLEPLHRLGFQLPSQVIHNLWGLAGAEVSSVSEAIGTVGVLAVALNNWLSYVGQVTTFLELPKLKNTPVVHEVREAVLPWAISATAIALFVAPTFGGPLLPCLAYSSLALGNIACLLAVSAAATRFPGLTYSQRAALIARALFRPKQDLTEEH